MSSAEHSNAARIGSRELAGHGKEDKPKKPEEMHDGTVHKMMVGRGKNKGYTAHHVHHHKETGAEMQDSEPHLLSTMQELQQHMAQHMPEEQAEGGEEPGAAAE